MNTNQQLAERLHEMALMLELLGENRFKAAAHSRAARAVASLSKDVSACQRPELLDIEGIGDKIADKIIEFCKTGQIAEHAKLREQIPPTLSELTQISGLGPKTIHAMWKDKGVTCLADLKRLIDDGSILDLPRMGTKTVDNIRQAIEFSEHAGDRLPLGVAAVVADLIAARLCALNGVQRAQPAGSLRRGRDTIGDIDILCVADDPAAAREAFTTMPEVLEVIASGETKSSIRFSLASIEVRNGKIASKAVQADLRLVPAESWGAALLYFTGSKEHNVRLRERALKKKLTLNEYGLYPLDKDKTPPQSRGIAPVAGATEEEIYAALDLPWIPPEIREDRGELKLTQTPRLIDVADIQSELHAHTTASDGRLELAQLVEHAKARGFHTIAVTDHSQSSAHAGGLKPERLRAHAATVREFDKGARGIRVLAGSEVDIHADGRLDYDDDLLSELDIVVASPHAALSQKPADATKRLIRAIEHPLVHIIGHPTGRLIPNRKGIEPAMPEIVAAAKEHNVALEINAHWKRLDLRDEHVRLAVDAGCLIAIDCDVHYEHNFDTLRFGVATARRGWLPPEQCINAWPAKKLHAWLKSKR